MLPRPSAACASRWARRRRAWPDSSAAVRPDIRSGRKARPRRELSGCCGSYSCAPTKRREMHSGSAPSAAPGHAFDTTSGPLRRERQRRAPAPPTRSAATWRTEPLIFFTLPLNPATRRRAPGFDGSRRTFKALRTTSAVYIRSLSESAALAGARLSTAEPLVAKTA